MPSIPGSPAASRRVWCARMNGSGLSRSHGIEGIITYTEARTSPLEHLVRAIARALREAMSQDPLWRARRHEATWRAVTSGAASYRVGPDDSATETIAQPRGGGGRAAGVACQAVRDGRSRGCQPCLDGAPVTPRRSPAGRPPTTGSDVIYESAIGPVGSPVTASIIVYRDGGLVASSRMWRSTLGDLA
jgi:hypothetical protein